MPTIDAPTHYDRSKGIMHSSTDAFFQWFYGTDRFTSDTGSVESSLGWVALCHVEPSDVADYLADPYTNDNPPQLLGEITEGWYIIRTDDNGFIWAMTYGDGTLAEEGARADFAEAEATYAAWSDLDG